MLAEELITFRVQLAWLLPVLANAIFLAIDSLVTHDLADIIPEIGRVILLRNGRVEADGGKDEILTADRLGSLFGIPVELLRRDGLYHLV